MAGVPAQLLVLTLVLSLARARRLRSAMGLGMGGRPTGPARGVLPTGGAGTGGTGGSGGTGDADENLVHVLVTGGALNTARSGLWQHVSSDEEAAIAKEISAMGTEVTNMLSNTRQLDGKIKQRFLHNCDAMSITMTRRFSDLLKISTQMKRARIYDGRISSSITETARQLGDTVASSARGLREMLLANSARTDASIRALRKLSQEAAGWETTAPTQSARAAAAIASIFAGLQGLQAQLVPRQLRTHQSCVRSTRHSPRPAPPRTHAFRETAPHAITVPTTAARVRGCGLSLAGTILPTSMRSPSPWRWASSARSTNTQTG